MRKYSSNKEDDEDEGNDQKRPRANIFLDFEGATILPRAILHINMTETANHLSFGGEGDAVNYNIVIQTATFPYQQTFPFCDEDTRADAYTLLKSQLEDCGVMIN